MTYTRISYAVADGVAVVTLSEPPANTYSYAMMREIDDAVALVGQAALKSFSASATP